MVLHLLLLFLQEIGSIIQNPKRIFDDKFCDKVVHSKRQVILSDFSDTPLPVAFSTQGWESLYKKPSRCPSVFIQKFYSNIHPINTFVPQFTMIFWGTHIVVTSELIFDVLYVPRVDRPNYPSHPCLRFISWDGLASRFYEKAMVWDDLLNFTTHDFAKGPRILKMVMTFVLIARSHYNTIIEPHAHFLFSLLEGFFIYFPSQMIISIIDIYQDTATCDKLIFPSGIIHILTHMHVPIPSSLFFSIIGAINWEFMWRRAVQLVAKVKQAYKESAPTQQEEADIRVVEDAAYASPHSSTSAPSSSSRVKASLATIMDQF